MKSKQFDVNNVPREVKDLTLDAIEALGLNPASFAKGCGFRNSEKMYHIVNGRNQPGYESLKAFISAYPTLNGDRFLRGTGPVFIKDLCKPTETITTQSENVHEESYWKAVAEERLKTIEKQDEQISFLKELLRK